MYLRAAQQHENGPRHLTPVWLLVLCVCLCLLAGMDAWAVCLCVGVRLCLACDYILGKCLIVKAGDETVAKAEF